MLTDESRTPATILEEWRTAERLLAEAEQGSADYDRLAARVLELARAYRDASGELAASATPRPSAAVEPLRPESPDIGVANRPA